MGVAGPAASHTTRSTHRETTNYTASHKLGADGASPVNGSLYAKHKSTKANVEFFTGMTLTTTQQSDSPQYVVPGEPNVPTATTATSSLTLRESTRRTGAIVEQEERSAYGTDQPRSGFAVTTTTTYASSDLRDSSDLSASTRRLDTGAEINLRSHSSSHEEREATSTVVTTRDAFDGGLAKSTTTRRHEADWTYDTSTKISEGALYYTPNVVTESTLIRTEKLREGTGQATVHVQTYDQSNRSYGYAGEPSHSEDRFSIDFTTEPEWGSWQHFGGSVPAGVRPQPERSERPTPDPGTIDVTLPPSAYDQMYAAPEFGHLGRQLDQAEHDRLVGAIFAATAGGELVEIARGVASRPGAEAEAKNMADLATTIGPQADVRDAYELLTGEDAITGSKLSGWQYGLTVLGAALPIVGGAALRRFFRANDATIDATRRQLDDAAGIGNTKAIDGAAQFQKGVVVEAPRAAGAADDIPVIGRQKDTAVAKDWPGHRSLDDPNWTLAKNDAWIQGIISRREKVYTGSPTNRPNVWDSINNRETVYGRELRQLQEAGYTWDGDYLVPPTP